MMNISHGRSTRPNRRPSYDFCTPGFSYLGRYLTIYRRGDDEATFETFFEAWEALIDQPDQAFLEFKAMLLGTA